MSAAELIELARNAGLSIVTAESCTGGMVAAALTRIPGASDVFDRGFVTYSNNAKQQMLGVRPETLAAHGAVSEHVAREMAAGAVAQSDAGLAVSITGIAGPGGSEFKPEGRVCFAVTSPAEQTHSETIEYGAIGRDAVRQAACDHALALLHAHLSHR